MTRSSWITIGGLVLVLVGIVMALMSHAASGPTFRAEDHASYADCIAAIPAEWDAGSLERGGAEDACRYVHSR